MKFVMHTFSKQTFWLIYIFSISISISFTLTSAGHANNATQVSSINNDSDYATQIESTEWEKVKEHNGISIYVKNKLNISRFRGIGRVKVNDPYAVIALMNDYPQMSNWFALISSVEEIHRDNYSNRYLLGVVNFPIMEERDFVVKTTIIQDPETQSVTLTLNNHYDYIPHNSNRLRFKHFEGLMKSHVISSTEIEVIFEIEVQVEVEYVPSKIVDYLLIFTPYLTIKNLREIIKNPKYHNMEKDNSPIQFKPPYNSPTAKSLGLAP